MRTKNAMQLKAVIRNRARVEGVPPQLVMQNYLLERLMLCAQPDLTRRIISRSCKLDRRVRLSSAKIRRLLSDEPPYEVSRSPVRRRARGAGL